LFNVIALGMLLILNIQSISAGPKDLTMDNYKNQVIVPESQPAARPCFYTCQSGWILKIKCENEFFCALVLAGNVDYIDECYQF
jgi:hypothetical protein